MSLFHYDMPLYRPPSEGENLIVQVTLGCSFNQCSFCDMYKSKTYSARPLDSVFADIDQLAELYPDAHRVFLADGDALVLSTEMLEAIADHLTLRFPRLQRISSYATPYNLLRKTPEELRRLKAKKLSLLYVGIESGASEVLKRVSKAIPQDRMVLALTKAREAGMKVSATVILGLGGKRLADIHIAETATLINRAPPTFVSTLQLTFTPGTISDFHARWPEGFEEQDDEGILREQHAFLSALSPSSPVIFRSNHASNCLPLEGTLPKDQPRLLAQITSALKGAEALRPEWLRRL